MGDRREHWPKFLEEHTQIRNRLDEAYGGPGRWYHNVQHLTEVFQRIDMILDADGTGDGFGRNIDRNIDRDAVLLAAWFHDAVYESEGDNEERSAVLAERELAIVDAPDTLINEVSRLVRLTARHRPTEDDRAGQVLCDADLGILAATDGRYREYVEGVRREHAHVPDEDFRRGRAAVLRDLVAKPTLFHTSFAKQHWENAARANMRHELRELEG